MGHKFKVGDVVRLIQDGVIFHSSWPEDTIQKSALVITRILDHGEVDRNKVEIYVRSMDEPNAHLAKIGVPSWFFWPQELVRDEYLSAIHHRRQHAGTEE